jgi:hypothetical protein
MSELSTKRQQVAQQFMAFIGRSDVEGAVRLLSANAIYRSEGVNSLSGTFTAQAIVDHLLAVMKRTSGSLDATKFDDWLIGEYHVACLVQVSFHAAGRRYSGHVEFLFRFDSDDLIDKVTVFFEDAQAFARFLGE